MTLTTISLGKVALWGAKIKTVSDPPPPPRLSGGGAEGVKEMDFS